MNQLESRIRDVISDRALSVAKNNLPKDTRRRIQRLGRTLALRLGKMTSWLRCLPNFLIIGAMRSGTTTLYNLACETRAVVPAVKKEVHYFDLSYDMDLTWYRSHFCTIRRRDRIQAELGQPVRCGEASPYYLYHRLVPRRVARVIPDVRLIAILRNPIDRAYSHYWHVRRREDERRTFRHVVEEQLTEDEQRRDLGAAGTADHQWRSYFERGRYVHQLRRWLEHFERSQLLVLRTSELRERPARTLGAVTRHLGQDTEIVIPDGLTMDKKQNSNHYPPMSRDLRNRLEAHYGDWESRIRETVGWM